ncbi:hypothetical protein KM043_014728 [Ampulex compressa]|nr:hypothetical protein KM043_014728 [Ampulex compressa]
MSISRSSLRPAVAFDGGTVYRGKPENREAEARSGPTEEESRVTTAGRDHKFVVVLVVVPLRSRINISSAVAAYREDIIEPRGLLLPRSMFLFARIASPDASPSARRSPTRLPYANQCRRQCKEFMPKFIAPSNLFR